jgi:hypothetical protein
MRREGGKSREQQHHTDHPQYSKRVTTLPTLPLAHPTHFRNGVSIKGAWRDRSRPITHEDCTTAVLSIMRRGEGQYQQGEAVLDGPSTVQQVHGYPSTPHLIHHPTHASGVVLEGA